MTTKVKYPVIGVNPNGVKVILDPEAYAVRYILRRNLKLPRKEVAKIGREVFTDLGRLEIPVNERTFKSLLGQVLKWRYEDVYARHDG